MAFPALGFSKNEKSKNNLCVAIDTYHSAFSFYSMENGDRSSIDFKQKEYSSKLYSHEFLSEFTESVRDYLSSNPEKKEFAATLLLPDGAVTLDTLSFPNINRRRNEDSIDAALRGLFKNYDDLMINRCQTNQTKQTITYSLAVGNKPLLSSLVSAAASGGMTISCISFASNAIVNAATQLSSKNKNSSYLMLDIKHHTSSFSFVCRGKTIGFYDLPFGYSILQKPRVNDEYMLFEHSTAELAVLNAREKARAKQLTIMHKDALEEDGEQSPENNESYFGNDENASNDPTDGTTSVTIKTLPKKQPRKLPKFMIRPQPRNSEEYSFENFRIFLKWALTLLDSNAKLTSQAAPEFVCVNMPSDLDFLFDMVNSEKEENGIEFQKFDVQGADSKITEHLELFGGLYTSYYNQNNNFGF